MNESNQELELVAYQKELLELAQSAKKFVYYHRQPSKSWTNKFLPLKQLESFCKRNYISKLFLFGSVLVVDFVTVFTSSLLPIFYYR